MATITRLVGVYDADHTISGEVAYWIGARLGRRHCSLCDITHGTFRMKAEWKACSADLPVVFNTFHRDDQPAGVRTVSASLPVVVAETDHEPVVLLDAAALEACHGDPATMMEAVERAVTELNLSWPSPV
jgi:hypothetical protein